MHRDDIIIAWQALPGTTATLNKDQPLNDRNPVAMELATGAGGPSEWSLP